MEVGCTTRWCYANSGRMTHPKEVKAFRQWAKLMEDQARVPERVQYKLTSSEKSVKGRKKRRKPRRKRFLRKRRKQD